REVRAEVDVREQADVATLEDLVKGTHDHLDARVVRRDAVAHEAERRGQALDEVDRDVDAGLREDVGGVDAGRTGADDRDAQGAGGVHGCRAFRCWWIPGGVEGVWGGLRAA